MEKNGKWIGDVCTNEFYKLLHDRSDNSTDGDPHPSEK